MNTRPFGQHFDALQLQAYAAQSVDVSSETTIERHLLECEQCRATLAEIVVQEKIAQITPVRLSAIWTEVASRIDEPPTSFVRRLRRAINRIWAAIGQLLAFSTATRSVRWVRWAAVPVVLVASALVIMNVVDTATSTTQQSVAARMPIPPADSAVADTPRGQALTAIAGGAPDEFASGPAHALPNVSGRPAATVPMPESVAPHAAPSRFRPGAYVAVFLPAVPDGNDVEVADGLFVSDGQVAAPDAALAGAEVVRQLVLAGDLTAQIMAVGDGRYVAYSGPYDTEQQAQAACAHFGPALRCVPARPAGRNESRIRGVRAVL